MKQYNFIYLFSYLKIYQQQHTTISDNARGEYELYNQLNNIIPGGLHVIDWRKTLFCANVICDFSKVINTIFTSQFVSFIYFTSLV
jgi:hypothetical protein